MPQRTIELLDRLSEFGFPDSDFWVVHHNALERGGRTIQNMRDYCEGLRRGFQQRGNNERVRERLEIVRRRFREGNYPHPAPPGVFRALCEAAVREIPM